MARIRVPRTERTYSAEEASQALISWQTFPVGALALFVPWRKNKDCFVAYNHRAPYNFLDAKCIADFESRSILLGRITMVQECVATVQDNPYNLKVDTSFKVLTARPGVSSDGTQSSITLYVSTVAVVPCVRVLCSQDWILVPLY